MKIIRFTIFLLVMLVNINYAADEDTTAAPNSNGINIPADQLEAIRFTPAQIDFLKANGFVIVKKSEPVVNFNQIYQYNLNHGIPNYVTIDSILNTTSKLVHKYLWLVESEHIYPDIISLSKALYQKSFDYYKDSANPLIKRAALDNTCFFGVILVLDDENFSLFPEVKTKVMSEIELLQKAEGIRKSPIFQYNDDYSKYVPKNYYQNSTKLRKYYQIKEWFNRKTFIFEQDVSREVKASNVLHNARCSLLIYLAINTAKAEKDSAVNLWKKINQLYSLFIQRDDKNNFNDYDNVCFKVFNGSPSMDQLGQDKTIEKFLQELKNYRKYNLQAIPLQFGVFNGHFSFNEYLLSLQKEVFNFSEIMNIFDSRENKNWDEIKKQVKKLDENYWFNSLEIRKKTWETIFPSLNEKNPLKVNKDEWHKRFLFASISSWVDMTEDKLTGVKSTIKMENSLSDRIKFTRGYVDPYPKIYRAEKEVVKFLLSKLTPYKVLSEKAEDNLNRYIILLESLAKLSEKEIDAKKPINGEEYKIIWKIGYELKEVASLTDNYDKILFYETEQTISQISLIGQDVKKQNIEAAIGKPLFLYVLVPDGQIYNIACGPIFSYYEFVLPSDKVVSNDDWQELLALGSPSFPAWIKDMIHE